MNIDTKTADPNALSAPHRLVEAREFLGDVREVTEGTFQQDISLLANCLCQLLDHHLGSGEESSQDHDLASFIRNGLLEVRRLMDADESTSSRVQELQTEAIDRWGEFLSPIDELDFNESSLEPVYDWGAVELTDDNFDNEIETEIVAPSAAEIASLLGQIEKTSTQSVVSEQETEPPSLAIAEPNRTPTAHAHVVEKEKAASQITVASLDPELREAFLDDASSCVGSMEASLLRLESEPKDVDALQQICRELHTLKGASASVGLVELADQLHQLEDQIHDDQSASRLPNVDSLLNSVDSIRLQIHGDDGGELREESRQPVPSSPPTGTVPASVPTSAAPRDEQNASDDEMVRVKSSQLNRLMDMLAELVMLRNRRETEVGELTEVYHELIGSVSKMRLLCNEDHGQSIACSSLQLSEVANDVFEVAQNVRDCARPVADGNAAVSRFIRQFRKELVELRRTPIASLFGRLQRVVRDAARAESKEVQLKLIGENAGIERSLQQRLYEPLLHIVRNCVCHGIELPSERTPRGKNPIGTITIEAKSGPDLFVIEICDDGGGLDYDAIRRRGLQAGLLSPDQSATRDELAQLIFTPGFSTRQSTNQVAGRGVGMDVVASTLQRMRGWLEIDSTPQQGTTIRLSFPLPSVIQHAMVFRSGNQLFAVPMQSVQNAGKAIEDYACLVFSDLLNTKPTSNGSSELIGLSCDVPRTNGNERDPQRVAILVDEIVGPEEVVVRPLPALLKSHPFCSGATLSGMGETVLLLDARRLMETHSQFLHPVGQAIATTSSLGNDKDRPSVTQPRVLVVDDSVSARKRVVRSLRRYPLEIVEACDGRQALQILKTQRFAAIFTDMEMPHVNGMELLTEVQSREGLDGPPVVIISSRDEEEFTGRAKELGANNYLIKPLADDALDHALAGIESLSHLPSTPSSLSPVNGKIQ